MSLMASRARGWLVCLDLDDQEGYKGDEAYPARHLVSAGSRRDQEIRASIASPRVTHRSNTTPHGHATVSRWFFFFEQLHLPGDPFRCPPQAWQPQISEDPLDRAHRHTHIVDPAQPQLRARRPIGQVSTRQANELDDPGADVP